MEGSTITIKEQVIDSIYKAIDSLNQTRPEEEKIDKSPDTPLNELLSSLDKVNLIVETEMMIEEDFGKSINLADQNAVSQGTNPLKTIETLSAYVESQIK